MNTPESEQEPSTGGGGAVGRWAGAGVASPGRWDKADGGRQGEFILVAFIFCVRD